MIHLVMCRMHIDSINDNKWLFCNSLLFFAFTILMNRQLSIFHAHYPFSFCVIKISFNPNSKFRQQYKMMTVDWMHRTLTIVSPTLAFIYDRVCPWFVCTKLALSEHVKKAIEKILFSILWMGLFMNNVRCS